MIKPAIVYIEAKFSGWVIDENGDALNNGNPFDIVALCTGFAVKSDGYIGTAGHCVDADFQRGAIIRFAAEGLAAHRGQTVDQLVEFGTANWVVEGKEKGSSLRGKYSCLALASAVWTSSHCRQGCWISVRWARVT